MPLVSVVRTESASSILLGQFRQLLDDAFRGAFSDDDWHHSLGGWHVFIRDGDEVLAHAAVVARTLDVGGRAFSTGYVEGVATAPARQDEGLGSAVMEAANTVIVDNFEFGALSTDRHTFYGRLGWERWTGPTFVRAGSDLVRTPDEDDGVMVLRFGQSGGVDLSAAITCDARTGDDW